MKRNHVSTIAALVVTFGAALFACSDSSRVINNPEVESASEPLTLKQVTLTDSSTVLVITAQVPDDNWIRIASTAHIVANGRNFHLTNIDGLVADEKFFPRNPEGYDFTLTFPALPSGVSTIDFIEGPKPEQWTITGIAL